MQQRVTATNRAFFKFASFIVYEENKTDIYLLFLIYSKAVTSQHVLIHNQRFIRVTILILRRLHQPLSGVHVVSKVNELPHVSHVVD